VYSLAARSDASQTARWTEVTARKIISLECRSISPDDRITLNSGVHNIVKVEQRHFRATINVGRGEGGGQESKYMREHRIGQTIGGDLGGGEQLLNIPQYFVNTKMLIVE